MHKFYAMDIETVRDLNQQWALPVPTAPGNYKKPEAIEQYIREARTKQLEQMALSPLTGRVFCVAFVSGDGEAPIVFRCGDETLFDEANVLRNTLQWLRKMQLAGDTLITYNGYSFDLPYIFKRAAIQSVRLQDTSENALTLLSYTDSYMFSRDLHIDLCREWCGSNGKGASESLDTLVRAVLGVDRAVVADTGKTHELIQTAAGRSALEGKCVADATYTKQLYERLYGILF